MMKLIACIGTILVSLDALAIATVITEPTTAGQSQIYSFDFTQIPPGSYNSSSNFWAANYVTYNPSGSPIIIAQAENDNFEPGSYDTSIDPENIPAESCFDLDVSMILSPQIGVLNNLFGTYQVEVVDQVSDNVISGNDCTINNGGTRIGEYTFSMPATSLQFHVHCESPILHVVIVSGTIVTDPNSDATKWIEAEKASLTCVPAGSTLPPPTPTPTPTPVPDQNPNDNPPPKSPAKPPVSDPQCASGSIIHVDNLAVGESVPVVGAPFSLVYFSDRVIGRMDQNSLVIPLTGSNIAGINQVNLKVEYAGRVFSQNFQPSANLNYTFKYDGHDSLGNLTPTSIRARVTVTYLNASGTTPSQSSILNIAGFQAKALGLGGWIASNNHVYDVNSATLYLGDGNSRSVSAVAYKGGLLITSEDGSEAYLFSTSGQHLQTRSTLTNVVKMSFAYDSSGRLISETDAFGNKTLINHSGNLPTQIVSPYGQITKLSSDINGYLISVIDPANETYRFTSMSNGLLQTFTKPNGHFSTLSYDSTGKLLKDAANSGASSSFSESDYNGFDTIQKITGMNRLSIYTSTNDGTYLGRTVTDPSGRKLSSINSTYANAQLDQDGLTFQSISVDDPRFGAMSPVESGSVISIANTSYAHGLVSTKNAVANNSDILSLNSLVQTDSVNDDPNQIFTTNFDGGSKQLTTTTPEGMTSVAAFDSNGQIISQKTGALTPNFLSYDSRGRLTTLAQGNRKFQWTYDAQGNVASVKDALGLTTSMKYDGAGRVTQQTRPDGKSIHYSYDASGNLISLTPANNFVHKFTVNLNDDFSGYQPPLIGGVDTGSTRYVYNLDKQVTSVIQPDGSTIAYNYDLTTGQLTSISSPQSNVAFDYDSTTKRVSSINANGVLTSYQFIGPLKTSESTSAHGLSHALNLTYSSFMKLDGISINRGSGLERSIDIAYDRDGRPIQIGDEILSIDAQSGLLKTSQVGVVKESLNYNTFGEKVTDSFKSGSSVLYKADITRNANGQITSKTETIGGRKVRYDYSYDSLSRFTNMKLDGISLLSYSYDANGNRTSNSAILGLGRVNEQYDAQDRLLKFGQVSYAYDKLGNRIKKSVPLTKNKSSDTSYAYDSFGHLKSVSLPDGRLIEYVIDGLGRRVGKKINGKLVQTFIYQSQTQIAAETDGTGKVVKRFVYGTKPNMPDYMITSGGTYRLISDQIGSLRVIIDTRTGKMIDESIFTAFGEISFDSKHSPTPFGFAGGLIDRDTGLTHFGAREYDAQVGRWISKDPIGFGGGDTNLYGYVLNDPINFIDPAGTTFSDVNLQSLLGGVLLSTLGSAAVLTAPSGILGIIGVSIGVPVTAAGVALILQEYNNLQKRPNDDTQNSSTSPQTARANSCPFTQ